MKNIIKISLTAGFMITTLMILPKNSTAQSPLQQQMGLDTIKTSANAGYDKVSKFKRIMFGQHYRKEWATEVEVEILDLDKTAGGLTPVKAGGGLQTKSLRLKGADGNEYVLRSVNKDPSKAVAPELRGTFAEDVVQDQISSANPYAPMVVASLAKAVGIFSIKPKMVYVPPSARLGEFAKEFGGTVCLFEERPSGNEETNLSYGYSKKVVNTSKMLEKIFEDAYHQVDERAFLKARLFDMLIGDWDRHENQWLWATFKNDGKTFYQPIPRDRDQAFSKMDGIVPQMSTRKWGIRKIQHFDYTIRDINGLNANGAHLDRNFTTRLTFKDWMEIAWKLQFDLTDEVIANGFSEMPAAIYNVDGEETVAKLKCRRDDLDKYAAEYYKFLSKEVNITGTKNKEIFDVNRDNDFTTVTIYMKKNNEKDEIVFHRTFNSSETKEIRLYGLNGDDAFNIKGQAKKSTTVRLIGGQGEDSVIDNSFVKRMGRQTKVYDDQEALIESNNETRQFISNDTLKNGYNRKAFAFDWLAPVIAPGYNPDDGFFIGGGVVFRKQQFGKSPFGHMQTLAGNYAAATGAYSMWYKGVFTEFIGRSDLHLSAKYNSPSYTRNYYGLGNETINDENADKDYYRVRISEFSVAYSLHRRLGRKHRVWIGSEFQAVEVEENEDRFIAENYSKLDTSVFDREKYIRNQLGYEFNTLDNALFPTRGVRLTANAAFVMNTEEREKKLAQLSLEASFFKTVGRFTLAGRTGASTNVGDEYEFFQANYLGGLTNLRGYRRDRFAGKTSVYQNSELRFRVSQFNAYVTKGEWGLVGFADFGRVWMPNEDSDTWHQGYGGGVWFLPFNKLAFTATYGVSEEDQIMSIKAGFLF